MKLPAVVGSGAGLVGGALVAGVGHASTVRPDPSILGVVGEQGSRREGRLLPVAGIDLLPKDAWIKMARGQ
jgi:hypothetical protein